MGKEELQEILAAHKDWLESDGEKGQRANLERADLRGAILRGADLRNAILRRANLAYADLRNAILRRADLYDADLERANLRHADLRGADLWGANLTGADLTNAILAGADLMGTKGIVSVGPMPQSGRMAYFVKHESCIMVQAGCFWGSTDDLKAKAQEEDKPWYVAFCRAVDDTCF